MNLLANSEVLLGAEMDVASFAGRGIAGMAIAGVYGFLTYRHLQNRRDAREQGALQSSPEEVTLRRYNERESAQYDAQQAIALENFMNRLKAQQAIE